MQPWAVTVNHKQCWAWHESDTVQMDRLGEPQNRRPAEQHPLPLQIRWNANNSKPTICSGQTKQVCSSVSVTAEHAQVSPKPAFSCIHLLHENLKGFWKPAVSGEMHCRRRLCCLWGQAFKSCKQASAPDNLSTRGKPAAPPSAATSSDQAAQQSIIHLCFHPILTQCCPNHSALSLSEKSKYHWHRTDSHPGSMSLLARPDLEYRNSEVLLLSSLCLPCTWHHISKQCSTWLERAQTSADLGSVCYLPSGEGLEKNVQDKEQLHFSLKREGFHYLLPLTDQKLPSGRET